MAIKSFHPPQRVLMGHASNPGNVRLCLNAPDDALGRLKAPITRGVAADAANMQPAV